MSLFDKVFKKPKPHGEPEGFFKTLTAYAPAFHTWSGSLYESELVRAAIHARANHISKLQIQVLGSAKPRLQTKLKTEPCPWLTWGQFLYRLSTILDIHNTAFIVPVIGEFDETEGYYPVLPNRCEILQYSGEPWLRYTFRDGSNAAIELNRCGLMTKFQYSHDFFGESNQAIQPTMDLINIQNQGISEGVKSAATFRFMAQVTNFTKPEDLAKERKRFTTENLAGDGNSGLLLFPNTYSNVQQINSKPFVIDAEQMKSINTNVYNYFGVNEDILQNKAFGDKWAAFYEGAIESFTIQFSDVMTKSTFTSREIANGSKVMATANRLQYMSNAEKLNVSSQMADRGIMNRDEIREIWNLPPLPDGQGQTYTIRGEYYLLGDDGTDKKYRDGEEIAN